MIYKKEDYNEEIQILKNLNRKWEEQSEERSVELFFSFDIVNSTAYKAINFSRWSQVIIKLFDLIKENVTKNISHAKLWKILGDGVIFIVLVKEKEDIFTYVQSIFEILNILISQLNDGLFFNDLNDLTDFEKELIKTQNIISLKASSWLAIIKGEIKGENFEKLEQHDNINMKFKVQNGYDIIEFLGNDIDSGFRIKENTHNKRLAISYELAYFLSKKTDYLKNLHIITYKHLKGIWGDRLYPIIWYYDEKYLEGLPFEDSFDYDEKEYYELVKMYFDNRKNPVLSQRMYVDVDYALNKILLDQNLKEKFIKIESIIQDSQQDVVHLMNHNFSLSLHCVAVCYDKREKRILIMKRADNRNKFANCWEFGCAKATFETALCKRIEEEYKMDFGIDIKVICDESREDKQPIPLATYEIVSKDGIDKGIITVAEIIGGYDDKQFRSTEKHSCVKWIQEDEVDDFSELTVTDFKNTLKKAFVKLDELNLK